jgi:hypothetical protein
MPDGRHAPRDVRASVGRKQPQPHIGIGPLVHDAPAVRRPERNGPRGRAAVEGESDEWTAREVAHPDVAPVDERQMPAVRRQPWMLSLTQIDAGNRLGAALSIDPDGGATERGQQARHVDEHARRGRRDGERHVGGQGGEYRHRLAAQPAGRGIEWLGLHSTVSPEQHVALGRVPGTQRVVDQANRFGCVERRHEHMAVDWPRGARRYLVEQESPAVRQEVRRPHHSGDGAHHAGSASGGRHLPDACRGTEDDNAIAAPRSPVVPRCLRQNLHGASGPLDASDGAIGMESDAATVGRPEGSHGPVRSRKLLDLDRIEGAHPERAGPSRVRRGNEHQPAAVRRYLWRTRRPERQPRGLELKVDRRCRDRGLARRP